MENRNLKAFEELEAEVVVFVEEDVVTASDETGGQCGVKMSKCTGYGTIPNNDYGWICDACFNQMIEEGVWG